MNNCSFIMRCCSDITVKKEATGDNNEGLVVEFRGAIGRRKKGGTQKQDADFAKFTAYNQQAKWVLDFVEKGMKLQVSCAFRSSSFKDAKGKWVYSHGFDIKEIDFDENKQERKNEEDETLTMGAFDDLPNEFKAELPF